MKSHSSYNYRYIILKPRADKKKLTSYAYYLIRSQLFPSGHAICQYKDGKFVDSEGNEVESDKIEHLARLLTK